MKKITILSFVVAALFACNSNEGKEEKNEKADITKSPDYQKGVELIAANDCLTCHRVDEKIQGPSYRDVANKYGSMPDTIVGYLAKKIISGGSGNWAETPLMTPHASLPEEDAKAMVKYILLLKNQTP
jgi:cytochrome c